MRRIMLSIISILLVAFMLQGCSVATSSEKDKKSNSKSEVTEKVDNGEEKQAVEDLQATDCVLLVNVNYESNLVMAKYSINVFLDGEEIATVSNGDEYFGSFDVKSGKHELTFEKNGDSDISNTYSFKVENSCTVYCSLKSHMDSIEITEKNATGEAICPDDQHQWEEATCLSPKKCKVCGKTEGELADHVPGTWEPSKAATCTEEGEEKSVCSVCGETITRNVDMIPHNVEQWDIVNDPTCTQEGLEKGVCLGCGQEITRPVEKIPHDPGDWTVTKDATPLESGVRVKKCKACDEVLENEHFDLTEEESVKWLKKNCQTGMYDTVSRSPNDHKGDFVKFSCTIVQVCSEASSSDYYSTYRGATKGGWDNVVFLLIDNYGKDRILEDDKVTVYGVFDGLYSYTTVLGASVTIPQITVLYYE